MTGGGLGNAEQDERDNVELPLVEQLKAMGWQHIQGDEWVPEITERTAFEQVLLRDRLRAALVRLNLDESGAEWLTPERAEQATTQVEDPRGAVGLIARNQLVTNRILRGVQIPKDASLDETYDPHLRFIDFTHPDRNDFVVINQFRVDPVGGGKTCIPDVVLFVNGIPLVVVECKSRHRDDPLAKAVDQLRRYSNRRDPSRREGVERLFQTNQLTVATSGDLARLGTFTAGGRHYQRWRSTTPIPEADVRAELGVDRLSEQQTLAAGVLCPATLLDIVRHYILWRDEGGGLIKIGPRYQQYRAVTAAVERLRTGKAKTDGVSLDERGGVVWQTQGSGKSLGMVFLVRKLRDDPKLRGFKVVFVTDRRDLERQLMDTAHLTGETLAIARPQTTPPRDGVRTAPLEALLREEPPGLVFATIQKYRGNDEAKPGSEGSDSSADEQLLPTVPEPLNESDRILVLVDEAHRSHTSAMNARLRAALPNAAHIGFTGTPILAEDKKKTTEIFGPFIDTYTLKQSEEDGSTVPIKYIGRYVEGGVEGAENLDAVFDRWFADLPQNQREAVQARYAREATLLEASDLIKAKAHDMLVHYVDAVMANGFKAIVVASSRLGAVRYQHALTELLSDLLAALDGDAGAQVRWSNPDAAFLERAAPHRSKIEVLRAAAVISAAENDPPHGAPADWVEWTDENKSKARVERFKQDLDDDGLAFLCVKSMLLTGFDAPVAQVVYLDRSMQGAELLQAIARVNRTAEHKQHGLLVDYIGITAKLSTALAQYRNEPDAVGALRDLSEDLPSLEARHARMLAVLSDHDLGLDDEDGCVEELVGDAALRAQFADALKNFLQSLDDTLPLPDALRYVPDAKALGKIAQRVRNLVRDQNLQLVLADAAPKVRALIDEHVKAGGVDPAIGPTDITSPEFDAEVEARRSPRAKAQVMEHAVRDYLTVLRDRDPARAVLLSERLEEILERFRDRWDDLLSALTEIKDDAAAEPDDGSGLSPVERPFRDLIALRTAGQLGDEQLLAAAQDALRVVRAETGAVDFWRNPALQETLRANLVEVLDQHLDDFATVQQLADEIRDLARVQHRGLHDQ